ncbi:hypothetical protein F511_36299 [Dorcoceras hygrometricum]|uniref:Uncharacterized protein n=1 Tax=Dorcoceras hygrometricum TaxID=472368 RepID=A0A2Z7BVF3_9LAMI|nr:hypothetical protein F511_36299 [Dorcoceras hygrometricum]
MSKLVNSPVACFQLSALFDQLSPWFLCDVVLGSWLCLARVDCEICLCRHCSPLILSGDSHRFRPSFWTCEVALDSSWKDLSPYTSFGGYCSLERDCETTALGRCEGERQYRTLISLLGSLATMRRVVNYHSSWERQRQVELFDASDIFLKPSFLSLFARPGIFPIAGDWPISFKRGYNGWKPLFKLDISLPVWSRKEAILRKL